MNQNIITIGEEKEGRITIYFSYSQEYILMVKKIKGYKWHPEEKFWSVPFSKDLLNSLDNIFEGAEIIIDEPLKR